MGVANSGKAAPSGKARHPHDSKRPASRAVHLGVEIFREEGDIEPLRHSLTPRQRAFCEEYVVDFNATAAMVRAGYSKNYPDRAGSNLLKNEGIAAYIDYLTGSKEAKMTAVDPDYIISQITSIINKPGSRDGDKLRGLELLARHLGMLRDRTEISGPDGEAIKMEQKTKENVEDFKRNLGKLIAINGGKSGQSQSDRGDD